MSKTALVLGGAGGSGFETAKALAKHGWRVRAMTRRDGDGPGRFESEWIKGDAMSRADVMAAAEGADVIVHAVNPPGYKNWRGLGLPMLDNTIAAAIANSARIVLPGTVYNYGPDAFPLIAEDAPQNPKTRKGAIRVEMEEKLKAATAQGARVLILRAGDFFGPVSGNSWFSQGMVTPGKPLKSVTYPGRPDIGHAWAYLPDFGETVAQLLNRETELATFDSFHLRGHYFARGVEFAERIRDAAGAPNAPIRGFPWGPLLALSPFVRLFREMAEMGYLWTTDLRLDNAKLVRFLGAEPHTPIDRALQATLAAMGVIGGERVIPREEDDRMIDARPAL
jgi:nucleoside-diphosphate-sugar epimerase